MKKFISLFILCGIFLGSLFAQDANKHTIKSIETIHAGKQEQGIQNYHKNLVFTEPSNETEDANGKTFHEFHVGYNPNIICENKYIKNTLNKFSFEFNSRLTIQKTLPIFLEDRSIRI